MNILIIGDSPHLNTSLGRIHRDLISSLKEEHNIESIATLHDISYFLPNNLGYFDFKGIKIHPYLNERGALAQFSINVMKVFQPQIVITIGERKEHSHLSVIKSMYPGLFKWIALVPTIGPFNNDIYDLNLADLVILTNRKSYLDLSAHPLSKNKVIHIPYGVDSKIFYSKDNSRKLNAIYVCKNKMKDNPAVFISALNKAEINGLLYYNADDNGEYDIENIIKEIGEKYIEIPKNFVSFKEGCSDEEMNNIYNSNFMFIDCGMQPKTSVSLLEAMFAGCLPIGPDFGATGDIIQTLPEQYRYFIPFEKIKLTKEEDASVIYEEGLVAILEKIKHHFMNDNLWRKQLKLEISKAALNFTKESFIKNIKTNIEIIARQENAIIVDSY